MCASTAKLSSDRIGRANYSWSALCRSLSLIVQQCPFKPCPCFSHRTRCFINCVEPGGRFCIYYIYHDARGTIDSPQKFFYFPLDHSRCECPGWTWNEFRSSWDTSEARNRRLYSPVGARFLCLSIPIIKNSSRRVIGVPFRNLYVERLPVIHRCVRLCSKT